MLKHQEFIVEGPGVNYSNLIKIWDELALGKR